MGSTDGLLCIIAVRECRVEGLWSLQQLNPKPRQRLDRCRSDGSLQEGNPET